jgi:hypothetical protein
MKRSRVAIAIALISVLGIFFLYSLLATGKDTTKSEQAKGKEVYVSEVVLQAPWAEKNLVYDGEESSPGEFGLETFIFQDDSLREELPDPPLPEGPTSFTVAPNGDIYITDPLNKRIQRFDANGNFVSVIPIPHFEGSKYAQAYQYEWSLICADHNNNIYLLWWEDYTEQTLCKYDPLGNLMATYPFFPEVRFEGGGKLYCDSSDILFFEYRRRLTDKIILSLKEEISLKRPYASFTFQVGTANRVFTPEEQKATLKRKGRETPDMSEVKLQAWKEPPGESWGPRIWNFQLFDEKRNLYHYWRTKDGITITKWYKQ